MLLLQDPRAQALLRVILVHRNDPLDDDRSRIDSLVDEMHCAPRIANPVLERLPLTVKVKKAGQVTATGKVGGSVVAKGSAKAKRPGKVTVRLVATKAWSKRLGQLAGKTLKISVKGPGGTLTLTRKLG